MINTLLFTKRNVEVKQEDCENGLTLVICLKNYKGFKEVCEGMGYGVYKTKELNEGKAFCFI